MILAKLRFAASFVAAAAVILAVGAVMSIAFSHSHARDGQDDIALVAAKSASTPDSARTPQSGQARDSIDYRVVDKRTSRPIPGVTLIVQIGGQETGRMTTDESGRATIPVPTPRPEGFLDVLAHKDGFAPVRTYMRRPGSWKTSPRRTPCRWPRSRRSAAWCGTSRANRSRGSRSSR